MRRIERLGILAAVVLGLAVVGANAEVQVTAGETVHPALPTIPGKTFTLTDYGAVGDGKAMNTEAFEKAIAEVEKAGGGKLVVPKGVYKTLPFTLCSSLDLHLDAGAVIEAPASFTEWGLPEPTTLKSQEEVAAKVKMVKPLINGANLHDVAITGEGTIDGNGALWWAWAERAARAQPGRLVYPRQKMVVINGCERLHVQGITLTNSSQFHLVPTKVTDLLIEGVKIKAPFNAPNTDAIDPGSCTNALIRDCDIDTGDDDIVIKTGGTNILIENCRIKHGHGISIGSGTTGGVHNMLVRNCTFDGADNGIRIKSMRGAGGPVDNIRYTNIQMKNVKNPILLDLNYVDNNRPNFVGDPTKVPSMHGILIENVQITGSRNAGRFTGLPDSRITDVTLRNVQIEAERDFLIKDADPPVMVNVQKVIKAGAAAPRQAIQE
jgi:polygalacturonase